MPIAESFRQLWQRGLASGLSLCLGLALVLAPLPGGTPFSPVSAAHAGFFTSDLEIFEEVLELVSEKYVYPPDYQKIFSSAIESMSGEAPKEKLVVRKSGQDITLTANQSEAHYILTFSREDNLGALRNAYHFLLREFPGAVKAYDLESAAINGMMDSLDSYSLYLNPEDFENSMRDTEGQYGGLGMVITMKDKKLVVMKTMKNSPARRAGMLPGDIITHVDGEELKEVQIQDLANRLRGYPDTQVTVRVLRPKTGQHKAFAMTREIISIETVQHKLLGDRTAYIKINSFSKQTNDQLEKALDDARDSGVRAFILDLRSNPGGLLNQSVMVASHFLEKEKLIVYTRGRHKKDSQEFSALYENEFNDHPVAILLDGHSASASEIVAGALRDSGKAILIGENSYGKGSVQTIFRMSDGSGLRLTTSKYFTPSGTDITKNGIVPEIRIEKDLPEPDGEKKTKSSESSGTPMKSGKHPLQIKETELKKFMKNQGIEEEEDIDSWVHFAQMVLKNTPRATRSHSLARARELVGAMHY